MLDNFVQSQLNTQYQILCDLSSAVKVLYSAAESSRFNPYFWHLQQMSTQYEDAFSNASAYTFYCNCNEETAEVEAY